MTQNKKTPTPRPTGKKITRPTGKGSKTTGTWKTPTPDPKDTGRTPTPNGSKKTPRSRTLSRPDTLTLRNTLRSHTTDHRPDHLTYTSNNGLWKTTRTIEGWIGWTRPTTDSEWTPLTMDGTPKGPWIHFDTSDHFFNFGGRTEGRTDSYLDPIGKGRKIDSEGNETT